MRLSFNPFLVSVAAALIVLVAIVVISHRRDEARALTAANQPGTTTGPSVPTALAIVLALAVLVVPFGIAIAALWGPAAGIVAYSALLVGGLIVLAARRSRGQRGKTTATTRTTRTP